MLGSVGALGNGKQAQEVHEQCMERGSWQHGRWVAKPSHWIVLFSYLRYLPFLIPTSSIKTYIMLSKAKILNLKSFLVRMSNMHSSQLFTYFPLLVHQTARNNLVYHFLFGPSIILFFDPFLHAHLHIVSKITCKLSFLRLLQCSLWIKKLDLQY